MRFRRSQTIREMASLVGARDTGEGFRVFSQLMLTAEDYLYSERFDRGRLKTADEQLARLEDLWR